MTDKYGPTQPRAQHSGADGKGDDPTDADGLALVASLPTSVSGEGLVIPGALEFVVESGENPLSWIFDAEARRHRRAEAESLNRIEDELPEPELIQRLERVATLQELKERYSKEQLAEFSALARRIYSESLSQLLQAGADRIRRRIDRGQPIHKAALCDDEQLPSGGGKADTAEEARGD